jgi:hypothetical protein
VVEGVEERDVVEREVEEIEGLERVEEDEERREALVFPFNFPCLAPSSIFFSLSFSFSLLLSFLPPSLPTLTHSSSP